jgi:UDP-3-O-[3-hydroxymyristoyl] N-acetylglucosamine deacetylase/3-hydroxyacyl-[acyl-carrier-protein] dehydratase
VLSFGIDYDDPLIGRQEATFVLSPATFRTEIAPARTFALKKDVPMLQAMGLARGGTMRNALVVDDGHLLGDQRLRFPDEFVRHKILDLLGDLYLLGMPIQGHIEAYRSGHAANVAFTALLAKRERRQPRIYPPRQPLHWDIGSIMEIMPHRYPFLLVDRIADLEPGKRVVGYKNVTINEPFFEGHFPGHPIMPAVLIIEAMAQTGGVLLLSSVDDPEGKLVYFSGIDGARFRQPVTPGDQLRFELEMIKLKGPVCRMKGTAYVGGEKVAEAELMSTIVER